MRRTLCGLMKKAHRGGLYWNVARRLMATILSNCHAALCNLLHIFDGDEAVGAIAASPRRNFSPTCRYRGNAANIPSGTGSRVRPVDLPILVTRQTTACCNKVDDPSRRNKRAWHAAHSIGISFLSVDNFILWNTRKTTTPNITDNPACRDSRNGTHGLAGSIGIQLPQIVQPHASSTASRDSLNDPAGGYRLIGTKNHFRIGRCQLPNVFGDIFVFVDQRVFLYFCRLSASHAQAESSHQRSNYRDRFHLPSKLLIEVRNPTFSASNVKSDAAIQTG